MKGRVVVLKDYGKPFVIEEYDVPDPGPGAVVVKMTQAGICGSDLHTWRGDRMPEFHPIKANGQVMGHEGTGVIARLGEGVTTDWLGRPVREGDRIVHWSGTACFRCRQCNRGNTNLCTRPPDPYPAQAAVWPYFTGTYADYFYVGEHRPFYLVPDELPDLALSWVNCAMGTSAEGLANAGCGQGDYVVIQGAGGLGLSAAVIAAHRGAAKIIVLDRLPERLALAQQFGADFVINVDELETVEARRERIMEITGGAGADIVMELVGVTELIPEGLGYLSPGGTLVEIGHVMGGRSFSMDPRTIIRGKRLLGSSGYRHGILPALMDLMVRTQDEVPYDKVVSDEFELSEVNAAMAESEWASGSTRVVRAILRP